MHTRGMVLTTSRLLSGRPVYTSGRLLMDEAREAPVLLDPDTGGELAKGRLPAFILSTEREATDGHIVRQHWDLSRADTVGIPILWAHDSRGDLLGQWREIATRTVDSGPELIGRADFDMGLPIAAEKAGQVQRGFLRAVSIGWQPGDAVRRSDLPKDNPAYRDPSEDECGQPAEGLVMGTEASPNRLFETSLVPVPADDGAFNIERAFQAAERAMARGPNVAATADLDVLIAAIGSNPAVRAFVNRLIRLEVEAQFRAAATPPTPSPSTTQRKPGTARFVKE